MRDSQRSRVYAAEQALAWPEEVAKRRSIPECQEFVDAVVGSAWWAHRTRLRRVAVIADARGGRAWAGHDYIKTSPGSRKYWVMLHELAHVLTPSGVAPHGPEYCANFVALTRQFVGKEVGDELKDSFRKHRVKVHGARKAVVRRVHCKGCSKQVSELAAWSFSAGISYSFCTKSCGMKWLSARLVKVAR